MVMTEIQIKIKIKRYLYINNKNSRSNTYLPIVSLASVLQGVVERLQLTITHRVIMICYTCAGYRIRLGFGAACHGQASQGSVMANIVSCEGFSWRTIKTSKIM